ncbi:MAG: hypothetical protein HDR88_10150 [Bacteroides sp.]|nr:hypothetical protein [Bacteroides sp.]
MRIFKRINKWLNNIGGYRITTDTLTYKYPAFIVEVQGIISWHTVKTFVSDDTEYAEMCANELLDMLKADI